MVSVKDITSYLLLLVLAIALTIAAPVSKSTGQNEILPELSPEKAIHKITSPEDELESLPVHEEGSADKRSDQPVPAAVATLDITKGQLQIDNQPLNLNNRPMTIKSQSMTIDRQPMTMSNQPMESQPMPVASQPIDTQPMAIESQPLISDSQPMSIDNQPVAIDSQPIDNQPMSMDTEPMSMESQPILEDTEFLDEMPDTDSLAPKAVAEYLFLTGDWDSFNAATSDLLKTAILTPAEVRQYREDVAWEYESIIRQLLQAETDSLAAYAQSSYPNYIGPRYNEISNDRPMRSMPSDSFEPSYNDVYDELRRMRMEELLEREAARDQLLQALIEDYVDRTPPVPELPLAEETVDPDREAEFRVIMDLMADAMDVPEEPEEEEEDERLMMPLDEAEERQNQLLENQPESQDEMVEQLLNSVNHDHEAEEQPDEQEQKQETESLQDAVEDELESLQRAQLADSDTEQSGEDEDKQQHTEVESKAVENNN